MGSLPSKMAHMVKSPLKIAFVSEQDPRNKRSWSGTLHRIFRELERRFEKVEALGPPDVSAVGKAMIRINNGFLRRLFRHYDYRQSLVRGYWEARYFNRMIREGTYDLVFAPVCSNSLAFLDADIPIVYLTDATFDLLEGYYPGYARLPSVSIREGNRCERRALLKSDMTLFSSEWARDSAVDRYGADPEKLHVVTMGANMDQEPDREAVERKLDSADTCRLLFLAQKWERKGGEVALGAYRVLREKGYPVSLTICGCEPEEAVDDPGVEQIAYLDKNDEGQYDRFLKLMEDSHFLLLPTRADCTPMVVAEANAYGMPVLVTRTGGIPSLVREGKNGFLLPAEAGPETYAEIIANRYFENPEAYRKLVQASRREYEERLNWTKWGDRAQELIQTKIG